MKRSIHTRTPTLSISKVSRQLDRTINYTASTKPSIKPTIKSSIKPDIKPSIKSSIKPDIKPSIKPDIKPSAEQPNQKPSRLRVKSSPVKPLRPRVRRARKKEYIKGSYKTRLPWVEKHRPITLDDISGHQEIISQLKSALNSGGLPNLILHGPPGTGKTSTVGAIRRLIYGKDRTNVREINASHDNGIGVVRGEIMEFARPYSGDIRMLILEEVDAMTSEAQEALRRLIETTQKHCRYVLICNKLERVNDALVSRCTSLRFGHLSVKHRTSRLQHIIAEENVQIEPDAVNVLVSLEPDFRHVIHMLQRMHYQHAELGSIITVQDVYKILSLPTTDQIGSLIETIKNGDVKNACTVMSDILSDNKWDPRQVLVMIIDNIVESDYSEQAKIELIEQLTTLHHRLLTGYNPKMIYHAIGLAILCKLNAPTS